MPSHRSMRQLMAETIDGVSRADWSTLGKIVLEREFEIANRDDLDAALRSIQWDARLRNPNSITRRHLWLALTLIQQGRRFEARRNT